MMAASTPLSSGEGPPEVNVGQLRQVVAQLLESCGIQSEDADYTAGLLVRADMEGISSHGVMLLPLYVERIRAGSVSCSSQAKICSDISGALVLDAGDMLGQLSSRQAVSLAAERAGKLGFSAVAVRNGFHFGVAGHWAQWLAERGMVGVAMSNTRPLLPAPGGAKPVVGNNPLALSVPSADGIPIVLDMAMSASAMGKIRLAEKRGEAIPADWATDARGVPTTDPAEAIGGMLLPAAGPKGFGLAFLIDLLCGGLSRGGMGDEVRHLYASLATPYNCAHFFVAIDIENFLPLEEFKIRMAKTAAELRRGPKMSGAQQLFTPGEPAWSASQSRGSLVPIERAAIAALAELAAPLGIECRCLTEQL